MAIREEPAMVLAWAEEVSLATATEESLPDDSQILILVTLELQ